MKASIFFTFALSALATAATTSSPQPIEKFIAVANETLHELIHFGCHTRDCLKALAPSLATCAFAAAQDELDPVNDALCFSAAAHEVRHKPASCDHCY